MNNKGSLQSTTDNFNSSTTSSLLLSGCEGEGRPHFTTMIHKWMAPVLVSGEGNSNSRVSHHIASTERNVSAPKEKRLKGHLVEKLGTTVS